MNPQEMKSLVLENVELTPGEEISWMEEETELESSVIKFSASTMKYKISVTVSEPDNDCSVTVEQAESVLLSISQLNIEEENVDQLCYHKTITIENTAFQVDGFTSGKLKIKKLGKTLFENNKTHHRPICKVQTFNNEIWVTQDVSGLVCFWYIKTGLILLESFYLNGGKISEIIFKKESKEAGSGVGFLITCTSSNNWYKFQLHDKIKYSDWINFTVWRAGLSEKIGEGEVVMPKGLEFFFSMIPSMQGLVNWVVD